MTNKKHIYFGIDLGTTNSCIAYGVFDPKFNTINPQILRLSQRNPVMGMEQRNLLPSAVFFGDSGPVVGAYAKETVKTQPSKVVLSVKNYMGTNQIFEINGEKKSPQYISSLILKHIKKEVERKLNIELTDVVIAVPASFDQDMRAATIEAAEMSGFTIKDKNGHLKEILIDEPRAALNYFIHQLNKGEIIIPELDLEKENTIVVFDLGGGTLDVSIHKMKKNSTEYSIEDIAISRYTQLGGDVFDKVVASYFFKEFIEKYKIEVEKLSKWDKYEIEQKLVSAAEKLKIEMTSDISGQLVFSDKKIDDFSNYAYDVAPGYILGDKIFYMQITKKQYDDFISGLLAWDLTIEDVDNFENLTNEQTNNIIYPILDVLYKAKRKLGEVPKIDLVLCNGGMTRVHSIKKRLEQFFGIKPYEGLDPDLSVALGACIHHYNLSQGKQLTPILAESVGLQLKGGRVKHLVKAGTALPFIGKWEQYIISKKGAKKLKIPLYLGEREDTSPPNRKIIERIFTFEKPCIQSEPVKARIKIDRNKTVIFEYFLEKNPALKYTCEANILNTQKEKVSDTSSIFGSEMEKVEEIKKQVENISQKRLTEIVNNIKATRQAEEIEKVEKRNMKKILNVTETIREFLNACNINDEKLATKISNNIIKSQNYNEFIVPIGALLKKTQRRLTIKRICILLGKLIEKEGDYKKYRNYIRRVANLLYQIEKKDKHFIMEVIRHAIVTIGRIKATEYEELVLDVGEYKKTKPIMNDILIALGKLGKTKRTVDFATFHLIDESSNLQVKKSAAWCLGKLGSREKEYPLPVGYFTLAIDHLEYNIKKYRHNIEATAQFALALGEICQKTETGNSISEQTANKVKDTLKTIAGENYTKDKITNTDLIKMLRLDKKMASIALSMIDGLPLTQEELALLDELREGLNV